MSTDKNTIKNWFKTGLKPNQQQFWSTWDSFWHKSETLPISSINGLGGLLDGKAEENHTHSEYATNDATSLTAENVTAWQQKLGVADLKFDDEAITITQDYADFGLVSGASINAFNNAIYSEVLKKLDAPTENATNEYVLLADGSTAAKGDLGKNFANTDLNVTENRKHTGTASVEFSFPFICSNASVRYSGLVDKSADATYNRLLGMNGQGDFNEVGIYALTTAMLRATDAQKDAWRLANQKSNEANYSIKPLITMIDVVTIPNGIDYNINVNILGVNLNMVQTVNIVRIRNANGAPITEESINISTFTRVSATLITVSIPPHILENGWVIIEVTDNFISSSRSEMIELTNTVKAITPPIINSWEYIGPVERDKSRDVVTGNKVTLKSGTTRGTTILNRAKYKADFKITLDMINNGFEVTIKTTGTATVVYGEGSATPVPAIGLVDSTNSNVYRIDRDLPNWNAYPTMTLNINGKAYEFGSITGTYTPTGMTKISNSTYTIKFKEGVMSVVALLNDSTTPHYKSPPIYVPISANVINNGLFICIDISDIHANTASAEVIDFKLLDY